MQTLTPKEEGACVGTEMSGRQPLPSCRTSNLNPPGLTNRCSQQPLPIRFRTRHENRTSSFQAKLWLPVAVAELWTLGHITHHKNMKIKIVKLIALTIVGICASLSAHCQTNSNGLAVIGTDAFLVADKNATNISLLVTVLNTTNHDIVVLTKGLNCG